VDPLQAVLGVASILALAAAGWSFARSTGLRRRLFVAIALACLVPAAGVTALLVSNARSVFEVLESPGLAEGVDGGLGLARAWLESEQTRLAEEAVQWGSALRRGDVPATGEDAGWRWGAQRGGLDLEPWLNGEDLPRGAHRIDAARGTLLLHGMVLDDGRTLVAGRRVADSIARDLERVQRGSQGFRQLELFYRPLLATSLLTVAVIAVVAIALIGTLVGRDVSARLVRPLGDLVDGTRRVAAGDLETRVHTQAVGEVAELVEAFNGMTFRLAEGERRLRRSERLAAWEGIARRLAHEIKNPLTPIQLAVHRLRNRADDPVARESLTAIQEEVENLQRLADEFSALGRLPDPRPVTTPLAPPIVQAIELYASHAGAVEVETSIDDGVTVWADPGMLRQVVSNLVKNAVQALGTRGRLVIEASAQGDVVRWTLDDDGPGLGDDPERVFDAGYTTKSSGTGLGLAIVQRIVEDHGGLITAGDSSRGGARFTVEWPARDPEVTVEASG